MAFGSRTAETLELVANKFDFDYRSPCEVTDAETGVIVLDPAHTKMLVQLVENKKNIYKVKDCIINK